MLSKLDTSGIEQHQISGCLCCDLIFPDLNQGTFLTLKYNPMNLFHKTFKRIWHFLVSVQNLRYLCRDAKVLEYTRWEHFIGINRNEMKIINNDGFFGA